jgi:hypothetical protein
MSKTLLLKLPDEVHETLKEYQIDRQTADRRKTFLNDLLVEIIQTSKPINDTARGILERAARKGE